jgi:ketosteroid isomerase-like protein
MKKLVLLLLVVTSAIAQQPDPDKAAIKATLDLWHKAAAEAQFKPYFALMTDDAVFIGTDATENWQLDAFKAFAKPYFDKGKAWNFTAVERNIYLSPSKDFAWFDELLDTQMKICRGSGVLKKVNGQWRIAHYVLSMTVPNDNIDAVIKLKKAFDDDLLKKLKP